MELFNIGWIFQNYFIRTVFRRWYVILAAFAGLWGTLEIWTRKGQKLVIGIAISIVVAFLLLIPLLFLINAIALVVKGIKAKSIKPLCPECFSPLAINFTCKCASSSGVPDEKSEKLSPSVRLPYLTYLTKGLFLNHCWQCSGEFFPRSEDQRTASTLRGFCRSCGGFIRDWEMYMLHSGKIIVSIEDSTDNHQLSDYLKTWGTGTYYKKIPGGEHYVRKQGKLVQHWLRLGAGINPESIPGELMEQVDYIWLDNETGSSQWQKTSTVLNYVRKQLTEITFGYRGSAEELRSGSLGIQESEIVFDISPEDFIEKQATG